MFPPCITWITESWSWDAAVRLAFSINIISPIYFPVWIPIAFLFCEKPYADDRNIYESFPHQWIPGRLAPTNNNNMINSIPLHSYLILHTCKVSKPTWPIFQCFPFVDSTYVPSAVPRQRTRSTYSHMVSSETSNLYCKPNPDMYHARGSFGYYSLS